MNGAASLFHMGYFIFYRRIVTVTETKVQNENYINIQGWMVNELHLKGNELLVYAIIYGFSQIEGQEFNGSLQYLADWCGATKQGILKNLKSLVEKGLIAKKDAVINEVKFCKYSCIPLNKVQYPIKQSLTNKQENKQENNIISKDIINSPKFKLGSKITKTKKTTLWHT